MTHPAPYPRRDNEFIAWYPNALSPGDDRAVWQLQEAAFYIHIPFCDQICDYCGFAVERAKNSNIDNYLTALIQEIRSHATNPFMHTKRFTVGHFGGGTPSVLRDAQLARILGAVNEVIGLSELTELTLEANPISLTYEKALAYRSLGINRLSIGVQSFNSAFLHRIGRPHRAYEAIATYEAARRAGFNNVSIDLMFALPGQQTIDLVEDLNQLVALAPEHISCFTLETIPMTPLWVKRQLGILEAPMPEMEREIEMYQVVVAHLTAAGYHHYGALNFARPGKESEHNRIAFQAPQGEYLGWGNSAYSFMNEHVFCNEEDVGRYIEAVSRKRSPVSFIKRASLHELASRLVLLGLKFLKVKHADFENRFGLPMDYFFSEQLSKLSQQHLISVDQEGVALTELGTIYVNNVCKEFFVGANRGSKQYIQYKPTINAKTINYLVAKAENNGKKSHV